MTGPEAPCPEYILRIRELPAEERPRERLRDYGAAQLSTAELLAIILRVGTAKENAVRLGERLLARFSGLAGLSKATFGELRAEYGLGEAKAAQVQAALELGRRMKVLQPEGRPTIHSPQDVFNLLQGEMALLEQERLRVVLLNARNQVVGTPEIYRGSVNSAHVRVAEVLRPAVRENCPAMLVVHNHPSGDPTPSTPDITLTKELVAAGKQLDIEVLDHIIIGQTSFVSMKELRLGF